MFIFTSVCWHIKKPWGWTSYIRSDINCHT